MSPEPAAPEVVKGSDLVATFLADREIRHVFGIIGAGNAHIFDSITRLGYTEIVCVHHEQAAVMAMNFYTRASGRPCAAIVTTGGGAANAFTGVVSGWMDSTPGVSHRRQEPWQPGCPWGSQARPGRDGPPRQWQTPRRVPRRWHSGPATALRAW
jgi:hypothetical protein